MESRTTKILIALALAMALALAAVWYFTVCCRPPVPIPVSSPAVRAPDGVRIKVEVINATTIRGLARRATMVLRDAGFDVVRYASEAARSESTTVLARSGRLDWAQNVAKALGVAVAVARPDSSRYLDVTVFLGSDWRPPAKPFYP